MAPRTPPKFISDLLTILPVDKTWKPKRRRKQKRHCFILVVVVFLIYFKYIVCYGLSIIIVKIISLHFKNSKGFQVKKHLATYDFVEGEMASES